jgi:hypothetical protein
MSRTSRDGRYAGVPTVQAALNRGDRDADNSETYDLDPLEVIVSLQGSLDSFALPDVLVLLASTKKSGELHVVGSRKPGGGPMPEIHGRLWFDSGRLVGSDVPRATDPADSVFELLRLDEGTFSFSDGSAPDPGDPVDVEPVLTEARTRLGEWREIELVVPSTAAWLALAPEPPAAKVAMRGDQWRVVAGVGGGCTVDDVIESLALSELAGCRAIKEMIEAGLVTIADRRSPTGDAARPARAPLADTAASPEATAPPEETRPPAGPPSDPPPWVTAGPVPDATAESESEPVPAWLSEMGDVPDFDALAALPIPARRAAEVGAPGPVPDAEGPAVESDVEGEGEDGDEPLNRGLLLKFLSSVRN